jgi:hypothetical protein
MPIALVNHALAQSPASSTDAATAPVDTTGASLLVAATVGNDTYSGITDSYGNSWVVAVADSTNIFSKLWYVKNPITGTGHTFTASDVPRGVAIVVAAFSGTDTTQIVDQTNSGTAASGQVGPGVITPSVDNELIVTTCTVGLGAPITINGTYIITDSAPYEATAYGIALAYTVQTTATTTTVFTPNWTCAVPYAFANITGMIASFKPNIGGTTYTKALSGQQFFYRRG